jgi:hypothetical protein
MNAAIMTFMKKTIPILLTVALVIVISCSKTTDRSNPYGGANFINAAPGITDTGSKPGILVFIDTVQQTQNPVPYLGTTGYLLAMPGSRNIQLRSSFDSLTKFFEAPNETFEKDKGHTYLVYDTLNAVSQTLKVVKLADDLTPPQLGFLNFRFINAAVNSSPLDVCFVREDPRDSLVLANQSYIGPTPNGAALSSFTGKLPLGIYTIKLKAAGTQNVLDTLRISLSPYSSIYTFLAAGTAAGLPLSIGAFKHYP